MDISNAILAKSDQMNAIDLTGGPQTVTVVAVSEGTAEQRVNITTDLFGPSRPFKPSKTVLRVLAEAWGLDTQVWLGRSMTLYRDPSVRWAGEEVGGIRVKALTHIEKPMTFVLPTSKGKTAKTVVQPLERPTQPTTAPTTAVDDSTVAEWVESFQFATTLDALAALWQDAVKNHVTLDARVVAAKDARKAQLT